MKQALLLCLACGVPLQAAAAPCLPLANLIERDARYEEAMRVGDVAFLQDLLADEYVWVHNLASAIDTKAIVLERARKPPVIHKSRKPSDVQAHMLGDTIVLRGTNTVEQWLPDGKKFKTARYQFMRTYVQVKDQCKLLSVQTMKVYSDEGQ